MWDAFLHISLENSSTYGDLLCRLPAVSHNEKAVLTSVRFDRPLEVTGIFHKNIFSNLTFLKKKLKSTFKLTTTCGRNGRNRERKRRWVEIRKFLFFCHLFKETNRLKIYNYHILHFFCKKYWNVTHTTPIHLKRDMTRLFNRLST